jgi:hypothetical protein
MEIVDGGHVTIIWNSLTILSHIIWSSFQELGEKHSDHYCLSLQIT